MGKKLDEALRKGDMKEYRKLLAIRIFFDLIMIVGLVWGFIYTSNYYADAYQKCVTACPCIRGFNPLWSGEDSLIVNNSFNNASNLEHLGVLNG